MMVGKSCIHFLPDPNTAQWNWVHSEISAERQQHEFHEYGSGFQVTTPPQQSPADCRGSDDSNMLLLHISSSWFCYIPVCTVTYFCTAVPWVPRFIMYYANYRVIQNAPSTVQTSTEQYGSQYGKYKTVWIPAFAVHIGSLKQKKNITRQTDGLFFSCGCLNFHRWSVAVAWI